MKKDAVKLITALIILTNIAHPMLWFTREADLGSQSQFWDAPNRIWYILMHIGIIMTFFVMLAARSKDWLFGFVSLFSILTVALDLGFDVGAHNVTTALLFGTAVTSVLLYGQAKYFTLNVTLCALGSIAFLGGLIGWLGDSGIFLGESIAEILISIAVLVEIWTVNKK